MSVCVCARVCVSVCVREREREREREWGRGRSAYVRARACACAYRYVRRLRLACTLHVFSVQQIHYGVLALTSFCITRFAVEHSIRFIDNDRY